MGGLLFSFYMEKDGDLWSACWFCGMGSKIHEGRCPSQQVAEQFNSMAKSDLRKIDPSLSTHAGVCVALETCVRTWIKPLPASERNILGAKYTLNAADSHIAMSRPVRPSPKMLEGKSFTADPPGQKQQYFPSIPVLVGLMKKKNSRYIQIVERGDRKFLIMATNRPEAGGC